MKTELLKSANLEKKQRSGVGLLFCACLTLFVFATAAAQVKDKKHVTAIQVGGAAEGSRVTVVSDSPLIDYEAFRRGDRFHVKIPGADLSSPAPHFRADGFEDVQTQKVGDSLIVSFKLQPGATARVDQSGNRLDVVFSAANRMAYSNTQTLQPGARGGDAAGARPSDSASSRGRYSNKKTNAVEDNPLKTGNVATASASPSLSPSSIPSPGVSTSYHTLSTATPAPSSSGPAGSARFLNWRNRLTAARQWVSANRLATLLGALVLLSLIVYLVTAIRRSQQTVGKTKQAKTQKVQPRPLTRMSSEAELTRPAIVSSSAGHDDQNREEEDREVFEL